MKLLPFIVRPLMDITTAYAEQFRFMKKPRPYRKCILPSCDKMTNHNGGCCCAEHYKEIVKLQRMKRQEDIKIKESA
jgi:hypothetical protein